MSNHAPTATMRRRTLLTGLLGATTLGLTACATEDAPLTTLAAGAPLPGVVPTGTTLRVGDKEQQRAIEYSGEAGAFTFRVEWANISGGPQTLEAFRAKALDIGAVADIPPIHAAWTRQPTRIVASVFRKDPVDHAIYELGVAPGVTVRTLADLRGKKIAYSPGQAQGALILRVLRKAGLTQQDVRLVHLASTGDVYPNALAARQVDVAPLGSVYIKRYLTKFGRDGGTTLAHGLRDDPGHLYVPAAVLDDADRAAAVREYVQRWARSYAWRFRHPQEWIDRYYVKDQGLTPEDGRWLVDRAGEPDIPADWTDVIARHQETIDLLAEATGNPALKAETLYDRRFESLAAEAYAGVR